MNGYSTDTAIEFMDDTDLCPISEQSEDDEGIMRRLGLGPVDLSIVIVGTNEKDYIEACLDSLFALRHPLDVETIVVDNASTDGTAAMLDSRFPQVDVIHNSERHPRSKNNNIGIRAAQGKYVLLLDPDTRVLPGALESMVGFLDDHPESGMCGCRLVDETGTLQMSCRTWQTPLTVLLRRTRWGDHPLFRNVVNRHLMADWDHATVREVNWMQGAAITVRREAIEDVGLMDEALMRYSEDIDWCFRFWKLGWKVHYVPTSTIVHAYRRNSNQPIVSANGGVNATALLHLKGFFRLWKKQALFPLEKRLIDIAGSSAGILLLSPLMALIAVLIRLDSPGPVFFFQERVGKHGKRFRMYKFRSMHDGADNLLSALKHLNEASGPVFKMKEDPRLTRLGKLLRRWSFDELPQLFNVLQGSMSLIGPRPLPPFQVDFGDSRSLRRLNVVPGISGLWQVSGRSDIEFGRWIDMDIQYIANQSVELEFWILARTFPAVVFGRGAY